MINFQELYNTGFFTNLCDVLNDGINIVDMSGTLIYVNKISADYVGKNSKDMIGKPITDFYTDAVLLKVLENKNAILDREIHSVKNKKYVVSSYPLIINGIMSGAFSVFRDIKTIDELNRKIKSLELKLNINSTENDLNSVIGISGSLNRVLTRAKRSIGSIGGPRHSIIIGESGTGKTMMAGLIYNYGKEIGLLNDISPFIEVNCAQFTNQDIAALEIFGSEEGAYTGAKQKKGLLEQADGGVLFLDEAHALGDYQNLLLKAIESGKVRRLGGSKEIAVNVIIIAASTKNLKEELLPELYQRLAQYELYLPSLDERSAQERAELFNYFILKYETAVKKTHNIDYIVEFTPAAKNLLFNAKYPRNIRQFRDYINYSIDQASPLISDIKNESSIKTIVDVKHLPIELAPETKIEFSLSSELDHEAMMLIDSYSSSGLGPRRISKELIHMGYDIKYYRIAYYLKEKLKSQ